MKWRKKLRISLTGLLALVLALTLYIHTYPLIRGCRWRPHAEIKLLAFGDPQIPGSDPLLPFRKRIDIVGNDMFLAHIVRTVKWWTRPDAVLVLGDLLSSQWISDNAFFERVERYKRIFPQSTEGPVLYNLSGNHDIGYHGEMSSQRVDRFCRAFGKLNFIEHFTDNRNRSWRLVLVNSLSLDGPAVGPYQDETFEFLRRVQFESYNGSTVLLTHIPLYKQPGVCQDAPHTEYYFNGAIKEQNHLSYESSIRLLRSAFSDGGGIILTGHDHEGCATSYTVGARATDLIIEPGLGGVIPEITVRSVMGEFGGNAGLVSGVWNDGLEAYEFFCDLCPFHVQHIWWIANVSGLVGLAMASAYIFSSTLF